MCFKSKSKLRCVVPVPNVAVQSARLNRWGNPAPTAWFCMDIHVLASNHTFQRQG